MVPWLGVLTVVPWTLERRLLGKGTHRSIVEAREIAPWLGVLTALTKNPGLILRIHITAPSLLELQVQGLRYLLVFLDSEHTHADEILTCTKYKQIL